MTNVLVVCHQLIEYHQADLQLAILAKIEILAGGKGLVTPMFYVFSVTSERRK